MPMQNFNLWQCRIMSIMAKKIHLLLTIGIKYSHHLKKKVTALVCINNP